MGIKKIKNFPFEGCIAAKDNLCWGRRGNLPVPIHFFSPLFYPVGRGFGSALTGETHGEHYKTGPPAPLKNVTQGRHGIQVRRKPGTDAAMTKASGGRPLRQENEVVTMAARLTDSQKKKILADYVQTNNYCATAKINGVSATTVKNLVRANADIVEKCEQKKEENTVDVLAYMDAQRETVCQIIGKGLAVLNDPEKLAEATPSQITTAIGTLIDKWTTMGSAADSGGGGVVLMPEVKTDA